MNETNLIKTVRMAAFKKGAWLLRNNSGATFDKTGRLIRYGLGNDSKRVNEVCKSSDLVGIKTITITPDMVGKTVGVFMAREVKAPGWKFTGTPREIAQRAFLDKINMMGGDAAFINDVEGL